MNNDHYLTSLVTSFFLRYWKWHHSHSCTCRTPVAPTRALPTFKSSQQRRKVRTTGQRVPVSERDRRPLAGMPNTPSWDKRARKNTWPASCKCWPVLSTPSSRMLLRSTSRRRARTRRSALPLRSLHPFTKLRIKPIKQAHLFLAVPVAVLYPLVCRCYSVSRASCLPCRPIWGMIPVIRNVLFCLVRDALNIYCLVETRKL